MLKQPAMMDVCRKVEAKKVQAIGMVPPDLREYLDGKAAELDISRSRLIYEICKKFRKEQEQQH